MHRPSYSSRALNALRLFHRKKIIIYVEGQDDFIFWGKLLNALGKRNFQIKVAGGELELDKYCKSVVQDNVDITILRDNDYYEILGNSFKHPKIIYTFGYSIENTLYAPKNLNLSVNYFGRINKDLHLEINKWLNEFTNLFKELILLDIANKKNKAGFSCLGDSCHKFLKSNSSHQALKSKIESEVASLSSNFKETELEEVENLLSMYPKELRYLIRGHFLTIAICNFLKFQVEKSARRKLKGISQENCFAQLIAQFEISLLDPKEAAYYKRKVKKIN